jgi:hypothetical protein
MFLQLGTPTSSAFEKGIAYALLVSRKKIATEPCAAPSKQLSVEFPRDLFRAFEDFQNRVQLASVD